ECGAAAKDGEERTPQLVRVRKRPLSLRPARLAGIAATIVSAVLLVMVLRNYSRNDSPSVSPPTAGSSTRTAGPIEGFPSYIRNTWNERKDRYVGVYYYPSPKTDQGGFQGADEGTSIIVVCQVRNGRIVTATPYLGRQTSSRVWDKLSNNYYISDI